MMSGCFGKPLSADVNLGAILLPGWPRIQPGLECVASSQREMRRVAWLASSLGSSSANGCWPSTYELQLELHRGRVQWNMVRLVTGTVKAGQESTTV